MIGIENIRLNKSAYFEQGMRKRWNIIASYVGKPFEIGKDDMQYQFYNNLPNNVSADLEYADLVDKNLLSRESAMRKMETVTDVEGELARIEQEQRQRVLSTIEDISGISIPNNSTTERVENPNPSYPFTM